MKRIRVFLIWIIGFFFITIGILKYINLDEMSKPIFERAHYPRWFFYVVGTIEFVAGILLLMTAATSKRLGTILIGFIMTGAIITRFIINDHYTHFILPAIILLLSILMSIDFEKKEK